MNTGVVRIGCGAAFWGDTALGAAQLVEHGELDYLMLDYLAEITMALLSRARSRDPQQGYAGDFVDSMAALAPRLAAQGVRVIANAGGVNPHACRDALAARLAEQGLALSIGVVSGDDLLSDQARLRGAGLRAMDGNAALPEHCLSINAYLGAQPIAAALGAGADIVITGRCVDSALALGPLLHEFGWAADDYDRLAQGSLAGHLLECGNQVTGGIFTDWRMVCADWHDMGFPIAECHADGNFVITKPTHTGGCVSPATVAEQAVYEIGDPARYVLPDVVCDLRHITLESIGHDRVRVSGARGAPPPPDYKVSATWQDGYRCVATMMIGGFEAAAKAEQVAHAIMRRTRRIFAAQQLADYCRSDIEVLGAEASYGAHARAADTREVVLKLGVHHAEKKALEIFAREFLPAATAMAQGITGFSGGRPTVSPLIRLTSCLVPAAAVTIEVAVNGAQVRCADAARGPASTDAEKPAASATVPGGDPGNHGKPGAPADGDTVTLPLLRLAHGRSGDKGDATNIGILARRPQYLALIRDTVTAAAVADYFAHLCDGPVQRYEWPGLNGFNFVLERSLGGGGTASLRYDAQGKAYAQMLLDLPIDVPAAWLAAGGPLADTARAAAAS